MSRGLGTMQRLLLMQLAELEVREHEKWAQRQVPPPFETPLVRCSRAQLLKGVCAADNAASQQIIASQRAGHEWVREEFRIAGLSDKDCLEDDQRERRDEARKYIQMLTTWGDTDVLRRAMQDFKPRPPQGDEFEALNPSRALRTLSRRRLIARVPNPRSDVLSLTKARNFLSLTRAGLAMARRLGLTSDIVDLDQLWPPPKPKAPLAVRKQEWLDDWKRRKEQQLLAKAKEAAELN